ncbi:MAG: heat-inducible transcriptional repressor HrcA [Geminicoccaceae bacterium]
MIVELNARSKEVFRQIVDAYVATGEPVGSRTIARRLDEQLSPATIRNVMADLEEAGLLYAPHTSAGRMPTEAGLRFYIDGLLELGGLSDEERRIIQSECAARGRSLEAVLGDATNTLSDLTRFAGIVVAPTSDRPFKHIEYVPLSPGRALVVMVMDNGMVENRVIEVPLGMSGSTLVEAGNFLTARLAGRSFGEARSTILEEIEQRRTELDELTQKVVSEGLATWADPSREGRDGGFLIVRGHARLLEDVTNLIDLERIRTLFDVLETRRSFLKLIDLAQAARGVQIFVGRENELFGLSGCSMVVAPYHASGEDGRPTVVGAIGVIGPTRMNYARIIPLVDYTARVVSRLMGTPDSETQR